MADEHQELRRVNWTELFSFTHVFKSFRMAIHPSKLLLALAAILLIYFGGRAMDSVWSWGGGTAQTGDIYGYYQAVNATEYEEALEARAETNENNLVEWVRRAHENQGSYKSFLDRYTDRGGSTQITGNASDRYSAFYVEFQKALKKKLAAAEDIAKDEPKAKDIREDHAKDPRDVWDTYVDYVDDMLDDVEDCLDEDEDDALGNAEKAIAKETAIGKEGEEGYESAEDVQERMTKQLVKDRNAVRRAVWDIRVMLDRQEEQVFGKGLFAVLLGYERHCFANAVGAIRRGNIATCLGPVLRAKGSPPSTETPPKMATPAVPLAFDAAAGDAEGRGALAWLYLMIQGPIWLLANHCVYGVIFLLMSLAIWAVFGGAIARIAALHAAREEKISMCQAIRFAISRFFSFFTAPLIPLVIILVLGGLMGLGGLLGTLPVGDIVMAVLFILALILGGIATFLLIGWAGGLPLMYPTIAVEGSDSFDAISRSYSYVLTRPWRYSLYSLTAAIYGTICYLFVRLCTYLVLALTHFFVGRGLFGLGLGTNEAPELADGATKMDLLWAAPTFDRLVGPMNSPAMSGSEWMASLILHVWVWLAVGMLMAFVLTFVVSSSTTIYYLLRRKVDATDLDDVYVEEPEEEGPAAVPEPPATPETPAEEPAAVAEEDKPEEPEKTDG